MRLKDKTAIVTGAASGFGAGIARKFAAEGARVMVVDLNTDAAQAIATEIGGHAHTADVSNGDQVADMIETAPDKRTRDAYRAAHLERSRALGTMLGWLKRSSSSA